MAEVAISVMRSRVGVKAILMLRHVAMIEIVELSLVPVVAFGIAEGVTTVGTVSVEALVSVAEASIVWMVDIVVVVVSVITVVPISMMIVMIPIARPIVIHVVFMPISVVGSRVGIEAVLVLRHVAMIEVMELCLPSIVPLSITKWVPTIAMVSIEALISVAKARVVGVVDVVVVVASMMAIVPISMVVIVTIVVRPVVVQVALMTESMMRSRVGIESVLVLRHVAVIEIVELSLVPVVTFSVAERMATVGTVSIEALVSVAEARIVWMVDVVVVIPSMVVMVTIVSISVMVIMVIAVVKSETILVSIVVMA